MNTHIVLSNEAFTARIAPKGAELKSLVCLGDGREYIWQGDAKYWKDSAPMLFPICGRLNGNRYMYGEKSYEMLIHGFLRRLEPVEVRTEQSAVDLIFCENEDTLAQYPFRFSLTVHFELTACGLICTTTVVNRDEQTMYYSIGAHPGFSVPLREGATLEDHFLRFPEAGKVQTAIINNDGLFTGELPDYALEENNEIRLSEKQFEIDGIFLRGVGGLTELHCDGASNFVRVRCPKGDLVGTWKEYGADAKFLCLEPWCGYPSVAGVADVLPEKFGIYSLEAGDARVFRFDIEICPEN